MKLEIFGAEWEIEEDDLVDSECDGECDFDTQRIVVNYRLVPHRKNLAVTHELLHALCDYVGIEKDEELVMRLEHAVYELICKFPEKYKNKKNEEGV